MHYKKTFIERLSTIDDLHEPLKATHTEASEKRNYYKQKLVNQEIFDIPDSDKKYLIYAILSLKRHEVSDYTLGVVKKLYDTFYDNDDPISSSLRKAICHLDRLIYREKLN